MNAFACLFLMATAISGVSTTCKDLFIQNRMDPQAYSPKCDDQGNYKPVQCKDGWCSCVTKSGDRIENFHVPEEFSKGMNCDCALRKHGATVTFVAETCLFNGNTLSQCAKAAILKPVQRVTAKCDKDGTYYPVQKDPSGKSCYCARPDDARKISPKYTATLKECPYMNCKCARDELAKKQTLNCDRLGNYPTDCTTKKMKYPSISCDENGLYSSVQCNPQYKCYCADPYTGEELGTYEFVQNSVEHKWANCKCARHQSVYQALNMEMNLCRANGNYESCSSKISRPLIPQGGMYTPSCNCVGLHKNLQCNEHWCFCSNPYGFIMRKYMAPVSQKANMRCGVVMRRTRRLLPDCARQEDDFIRNSSARIFLGCDHYGNFPSPYQLKSATPSK